MDDCKKTVFIETEGVGSCGTFIWKIRNFSFSSAAINGIERSENFQFLQDTLHLEIPGKVYVTSGRSLFVRPHREGSRTTLNSKLYLMNDGDMCSKSFQLLPSAKSSAEQRLITELKLWERKKELLPDDCLCIVCKVVVVGIEKATRTKGIVSTSARNSLSRDLNRLLTTETNSHVDVLVESRRIRAHSLILSARSPVFAAMFQHDMEERRQGVVNIKDFSISTVQRLLHFIYTNEVPSIESLSSESLVELYTAADKYEVTELADMCLQSMEVNFSEENLKSYATLAVKHDKQRMLDAVASFIADNPHVVQQR